VIKNVVCIHEEDAGLLWKHTDFRPGGRGQSVRSRRLVVSMVCTLANYVSVTQSRPWVSSDVLAGIRLELPFLPRFVLTSVKWGAIVLTADALNVDGSIEFEIRLTGILQVYAGGDNGLNPFGTMVAPGVLAQYHQHLFSVRIDPMIDGIKNSVVESDIVPLPNAPTGSAANFAGNAFVVHEKVLKTAREGACDYNWETDRRWRIVNPARTHYASGKQAGYTIHAKGGMTGMLAQADSWIAKRASFTKKALWVVPDAEDKQGSRMWPAGKFVPGSREEPNDSVAAWSANEDNIENEDVVLFLTVGTTHIPRPEDWPVYVPRTLTLFRRTFLMCTFQYAC
jgi:primary-amine oxidase